jgi:hypothetical protein
MRQAREVEHVAALLASGLNAKEASHASGVPWRTIQKWRQAGIDELLARRRVTGSCAPGRCDRVGAVDRVTYAYLLGQYLGDGSIALVRRTHRFEVYSDMRYPGIIDEVQRSMRAVMPTSRATVRARTGCVAISSYSNHWPCMFPQHGAGPKHTRPIVLEPWQREIVTDHPWLFLRGLIHSDGCRVLNKVKGTAYPRYHFSNRSDDIRGLFAWACRVVGVECRPNNRWNLSVARRASVELMDDHIGPKA